MLDIKECRDDNYEMAKVNWKAKIKKREYYIILNVLSCRINLGKGE